MPDQFTYRSQVLDHLGLVAGRFDELGMGDVIDQVTHQNPEMRDLTPGEAVKALVLNGRGLINQARYLGPRFFQSQPTSRLLSPRVAPDQLNDEARGRTSDTLYAYGVTELYRLTAATAAERLGLTPRVAQLESTRVHVEGRDNRDEAPEGQGIPITRGSSRAHRPDLQHVLLGLSVEHQAGIPILRQPRSGNRSDAQTLGQVIRAHLEPWPTTSGVTSVVADRALYSAANLQQLAQTARKGSTRVPATVREAQAALAQGDLQALASRQAGDRDHEVTSTSGGMAQRWGLIDSGPRQPQAQRTVDRQLRQPSDQEGNARKTLGSSTFACEAAARQALASCEQDVQATCLSARSRRATPRSGLRGRPRHGTPPAQLVYQIDAAVASSLTTRQARSDRQRRFLRAPNELDHTQLPPQEVWAGDKGQGQAARGVRLLKDPQLLAASRYLKKPERMRALRMGMTVCRLVDAALEYRLRQARKDHEATVPDHQGQRIHHPTARWVLQYFVGLHWRCQAGPWPLVRHLTEEQQHLLRLLGTPYRQFYAVRDS